MDVPFRILSTATLRHETGAQVLRAVGERVRCSLRTGDLACSYGGKALTLILPGAGLNDARTRLEELRRTLMLTSTRYRDRDLPVVMVSIAWPRRNPPIRVRALC